MAFQKKGILLYGANGYTGRLITAVARREGLPVVLAGRRVEAVRPLAEETGLLWRVFNLDDPKELAENLENFKVLLLAAGPFSKTSQPALDACLKTKTHYLDITGEIDVYEALFAREPEVRAAGITVLPGAGFDVVPSDCLAKSLKEALPSATSLELAFRGFTFSGGTLKTMLEGAARGGGVIRKNGALVPVPPAYAVKEIPFSDKKRTAMSIPWGDLSTAYRSTGIPNIVVFMAVPGSWVFGARATGWLAPVLKVDMVQNVIKSQIGRFVDGPGETEREKHRSILWGRVTAPDGTTLDGSLETLEGYTLTSETAVACARRVLEGAAGPGVWTPSLAFGARFIETFPGSKLTIGRPQKPLKKK
jgi:saccharopine dehydrogenase (NAD+, L-lysine-forming)